MPVMKTRLIRLLLTAVLTATLPVAAMADASHVALRLISFNDFHGKLLPSPTTPGAAGRSRGGAAAMEAMVKDLRKDADHSLVVSAGDMIGASPLESALFYDEPTVEAMNAIGVDIGVIGNHELDRGLAELLRHRSGGCAAPAADARTVSCKGLASSYSGARFRLLAANVVDQHGKRPFDAYAVRKVEGVPMAFIGVVTRSTSSLVQPSGIVGLRFLDEANTVNRHVRKLRREQGIRAFVVLIHEGGFVDASDRALSCPTASGPVFNIADRIDPDVRVIISGHTHQEYQCVRGGKLISQSGSYGKTLGKIDLALDRRDGRIDLHRTRFDNVPVTAEPEPSSAETPVASLVRHYEALAQPIAAQEIATIDEGFDRAAIQQGNSTLGALVADAQLAATSDPKRGGAQFALMNSGGLRADLGCTAAPCVVRYGDVISAQPFSNQLVTMSLSGRQLIELLEQMARRPRLSVLHPSAGFSYTLDLSRPPGERVVEMRLHGELLRAHRTYRVTVNAFLAEGGDGFSPLKTGLHRVTGGIDADALVDYLKAAPRQPDRSPRVIIRQAEARSPDAAATAH